MHRPLETTFWMRFSRFLKGVFLYNTIYWKRASDDLDIQRMSREERASMRPKRNLDIIRPRENPRPTTGGPAPSLLAAGEISEPVQSTPVSAEAKRLTESLHSQAVATGEEGVEIHRRKKRRRGRHRKVLPKQYYDAPHENSGGIFGWLFKK